MKWFFLFSSLLLGTFWIKLAEPIIPMGLFIGSILYLRKKSFSGSRIMMLLLGTVGGFLGNGVYVQFYNGKLLAGVNFELIVPSHSFNSANIAWGKPAHSAKYFGKTFKVAAAGDSDKEIQFPVNLKTEGGAVTQYLNIEFTSDNPRISQHCVYTNEQGRFAEAVSVSVDLPANKIEHGFEIMAPIEKTEWVRGKRCALEFAEGTWIFMGQKDVLRLYNTPTAYIELAPIQP